MAASKDEVPIGAIIVLKQQSEQLCSFCVLSAAHNLVETLVDASAHAELLALRSAALVTKNWRLYNTTLYCTLEPCPMCLSACQAFRVDTIVYGARDVRLGAIESYINLLDEANPPHPYHPSINVVAGVRAEECSIIMKDFFRAKRQKREEKTSGLQRDGQLVADSLPVRLRLTPIIRWCKHVLFDYFLARK